MSKKAVGQFLWNMIRGVPQVGNKLLGAAGKNNTLGNALGLKKGSKATSAIGKLAQKTGRGAIRATPGVLGAGAVYSAAGQFLPDGGPDEQEMAQRAYNQLAYGVDMTNEQMQEAEDNGQEFTETGMIGEGGLDPEQVKAYIIQESRDKLGEQNWYSGLAKKGLGLMEWAGAIGGGVATGANAFYDSQLGGARNQELQNIVTKLKQDHNERAIRADREGTMGKAMTDGLLGEEFGSGRVTKTKRGGIRPPVDPNEAKALKEYNKIKAEKGVGYAIKSEFAKSAGRQVYEDINDLIPSEGVDPAARRSAMENLLQQAGIMDVDTYMKNATGKTLTEMNAEQAQVNQTAATTTAVNEAAAQQAAAERAFAEEAAKIREAGPMSLRPAEDAEGVRRNREAIVARNGYHGESPQAEMQRSYFEDRGVPTERGMNQRLEAAADYAYEKQYGVSRNSPEAVAQLLYRHALKVQQGQKAYQDNRARMADIEYAKHIVKPGDPDYKLGPQVTASTPDEMAQADRDSAASMGDGSVPTAPAPLPAQVRASAQVQTAPAPSRSALLGPRATVPPTAAPTAMSPTPNGIGTSNRGTGLPNLSLPQVPDIGAPARRAGEAFGNSIFSQDGTGIPLPGGAKLKAPQLPDIGAPVRNAVDRALTQQSSRPSNVMAPTPYGIGTATPGIPQAPDIGAPVRNAVQGALTQQSSPPGVVPQGPMGQTEIAKMLAEQKRKEIEARNKANPQRSPIPRPNPMGRFIR